LAAGGVVFRIGPYPLHQPAGHEGRQHTAATPPGNTSATHLKPPKDIGGHLPPSLELRSYWAKAHGSIVFQTNRPDFLGRMGPPRAPATPARGCAPPRESCPASTRRSHPP